MRAEEAVYALAGDSRRQRSLLAVILESNATINGSWSWSSQ